MAYYVGTQQFPSIYAAARYLSQNPQPGMTITSAPVAPAGMMTGGATKGGTMYAGGTPNFDERTGQPTGTTKGGPTKQAPIVTADPAPAPAPAPEPAPEPEPEMTFTFVEGKERGGAAQNYLYGQEGEVQQLTVDELREYFESDKVNRLPEVFGTFENYLAYMTEREQLIQSGDYDVGNWSEADTGFTQDQEMLLAGEDLTIDPSDPMQDPAQLERMQTQTQAAAYNNWINSEANQALLQKYGVNPVVYSNSGDKFAWNGSAYVKVVDEDHAGLADFVKMGITTAIGIMSGQALAPLLGGVGSAVTSSAISQAVSTGSIDPKQLLTSAATAGITQALTDVVGPAFETATGLDLSELTTGNAMADDALRAMGNSVISQGLVNGEVDINQVFTAGLFTTLDDVVEFFFPSGATEEEARALWDNPMMREQAADLNAQLEDQFDTTVSGLINSMDADTASYFASLTSDLNEQLTDEGAWGVTTDFDLPETPTASQIALENLRGTSQDLSTYDNLSDDDARRFMERYGFSNEDIENYLSLREPPEVASGLLEWSNTGMMADPDMPFSINVRPDTNEYFIVDPEGNYKAISEADARALMAFEDADDWDGFTKYMNDKGIAGGGVIFGGFTDDGRPILDGADYDDWLTSSDSQPRFVDVEFVDPSESTIPDPEIPEQEVPQPTEPVEPPEPPVVEPPEPPPESEPVEPVPEPEPEPLPQQQQVQQAGDAGTASPSPDPTTQPDPSFAPAPTPAPQPAPAPTPQEEAPITTGMFEEYFPEPAPAPAPAPVDEPPPEPYQQGSLIGDARALIEEALRLGATVDYLQQNFPQYSDLINEVSSQLGGMQQQPSLTVQDVESVVNNALSNIPAGTTPEEVTSIVNQAISNISIPEGMTEDQVSTIVNSAIEAIEFPQGITSDDVSSIVDTAIANIEFPQGITSEDVEGIVNEAIGNIPAGTSADQVQQIVDTAIGNIQFPEGMTPEQVQEIVSGAIGNIEFPQSLTASDVNDIVSSAISNIEFPEATTSAEVTDIVQNILSETPFATPEEVVNAVAQAGYATPADIGTALAQAGFATPEDITRAVAGAGFTTPEDVASALANAGYVTPEQLGNALAASGFATPEDIENAVAGAGFATPGDIDRALQGAGFATAGEVEGVERSLQEALQSAQAGQARALSDAEARLLEQITGVNAQTLQQLSTVEGALNNRLTSLGTSIDEVQSNLESSIAGIATGQEQATEERRNLQQAIIGAQGDIEALDENTRRQFEEFGGTVNELFSDVNVDIEALQAGQISQAEAQQAFQQSTEERFGELGGQIGDIGTQLGGLASDVSGIGQGLEGLGTGIAGLGEGLGAGLLGLAAQQAMLPGQIAAATPIQPVEFEKFQRGLTRRKLADPLRIGMFTGGARSV